MRLFFSYFFVLSFFSLVAQEAIKNEKIGIPKIDSLYREDQFYFGFTINNLLNKPVGLSQDKLSTGFSLGFSRDMPINKLRTVAFASGIGFTYNNYIENIKIDKTFQDYEYTLIPSGTSFSKNRISQLFIDVPIEFRWRTSTYESYKFWRIYGGLKFSYLIYDRYIYSDSQGKLILTNNPDFNKIQYGAYVSAGFNTFNAYVYYGLNPIFKSAKIEGQSIDMRTLNVGIIFYIL